MSDAKAAPADKKASANELAKQMAAAVAQAMAPKFDALAAQNDKTANDLAGIMVTLGAIEARLSSLSAMDAKVKGTSRAGAKKAGEKKGAAGDAIPGNAMLYCRWKMARDEDFYNEYIGGVPGEEERAIKNKPKAGTITDPAERRSAIAGAWWGVIGNDIKEQIKSKYRAEKDAAAGGGQLEVADDAAANGDTAEDAAAE